MWTEDVVHGLIRQSVRASSDYLALNRLELISPADESYDYGCQRDGNAEVEVEVQFSLTDLALAAGSAHHMMGALLLTPSHLNTHRTYTLYTSYRKVYRIQIRCYYPVYHSIPLTAFYFILSILDFEFSPTSTERVFELDELFEYRQR